MRSFTLVSLLTLCSLISHGQVQYGALAGWNYVDAQAQTKEGQSLTVKSGNGFHLGLMLKVPFDKKIFFAPQLLYSYKTYTPQFNDVYEDSVLYKKLGIHYIEIPALLEFDLSESASHFFFQFGPSLSIAIAGKEKITSLDGSTVSQKMDFDFYAYDHFEFNLVGKAGYRFKNKMIVSSGYALGLGSIIDDDKGPIIKPRTFTLSIGYWFR